MEQFHFDPATYADCIHAEIPAYDELQDRIAASAAGLDARRILDLGSGTGETARRVLAVHPSASGVAVDESAGMLERLALPNVRLVTQRLQEALPQGPFDLIVSALAVHHLDGAEKRELFRRVFTTLRSGGRFVLGDVVVVDRPVAPLTEGYDKPDTAEDQVTWLRDAGFRPRIGWQRDDLALIVAERP